MIDAVSVISYFLFIIALVLAAIFALLYLSEPQDYKFGVQVFTGLTTLIMVLAIFLQIFIQTENLKSLIPYGGIIIEGPAELVLESSCPSIESKRNYDKIRKEINSPLIKEIRIEASIINLGRLPYCVYSPTLKEKRLVNHKYNAFFEYTIKEKKIMSVNPGDDPFVHIVFRFEKPINADLFGKKIEFEIHDNSQLKVKKRIVPTGNTLYRTREDYFTIEELNKILNNE